METARKEVKIIKPIMQNSPTKRIRVGAYCRVSTNKEDQLNSFFAQMQYYSDYVRNNDTMTLVDIYADEGISGTSLKKREELKRLIKDCQNRKLDRVLVKSVTRFARNSLECIETVRKLKSYGVSIYFENDNIDTSRMNSEMILYIKSAFAQGEALSASKRMSTSIRMRMEDGTYIHPKAPFGYTLESGELIVIEEEAKIIREIFSMYLSGLGCTYIAKVLNGKTECQNIKWHAGLIRYILSNEKYKGDSLFQKTHTPNILPLRNIANRGEKTKYYSEGTQEAIVSKEDYNAVQSILKERSDKHYKGVKKRFSFLQEKIYCRKCGWKNKIIYRNNEVYYTCSKKGKSNETCHSRTYSDNTYIRAFIKLYNMLRQNEKLIIDETISQFQMLKQKINGGNTAITEIDEEIAKLGEESRLYADLYEKAIIDEFIFAEQSDRIKCQMFSLRDRRVKLISEDDDEKCIEQLRQMKRDLHSFPNKLYEMDKKIFEILVEKIYVDDSDTLSFILKGEIELKVKVGG